jgi:hypothetical protein
VAGLSQGEGSSSEEIAKLNQASESLSRVEKGSISASMGYSGNYDVGGIAGKVFAATTGLSARVNAGSEANYSSESSSTEGALQMEQLRNAFSTIEKASVSIGGDISSSISSQGSDRTSNSLAETEEASRSYQESLSSLDSAQRVDSKMAELSTQVGVNNTAALSQTFTNDELHELHTSSNAAEDMVRMTHAKLSNEIDDQYSQDSVSVSQGGSDRIEQAGRYNTDTVNDSFLVNDETGRSSQGAELGYSTERAQADTDEAVHNIQSGIDGSGDASTLSDKGDPNRIRQNISDKND